MLVRHITLITQNNSNNNNYYCYYPIATTISMQLVLQLFNFNHCNNLKRCASRRPFEARLKRFGPHGHSIGPTRLWTLGVISSGGV